MGPNNQRGGSTQAVGREEGAPGTSRAAAIARLAYEKWRARGCPDGDDRRDWFEAEREIAAGILAEATPLSIALSKRT